MRASFRKIFVCLQDEPSRASVMRTFWAPSPRTSSSSGRRLADVIRLDRAALRPDGSRTAMDALKP
ncbi:hypothetical protein [Pendulispora albinea]|uniref:Uncharacterized protein n=1 Tax=Pendulispora albinea TaxID=2741071 RepID=A0ABZ2LN17_9BACT